MLRTPRQERQRGRIRVQEQIGVNLTAKSGNGGSIDGDAVGEGAGELAGHDRNVLLIAVDVAERHADELDVLFLDILHDLILCVFHQSLSLP